MRKTPSVTDDEPTVVQLLNFLIAPATSRSFPELVPLPF